MKNTKGFTLVEILVVISIIAILSAIVTPSAFKIVDKAKASSVSSDVEAIKEALFLYYADTGEYPSYSYSGTSRDAFNWIGKSFFITGDPTTNKPSGVNISIPSKWDGPYLDSWREKNPFGGYYTVFDYGDWKNNDGVMKGIKKYTDNSRNFWTEYQGVRIITIEVGFGSDLTTREKALEILSNYGDSGRLYYQNYNDGGTYYYQIIIPILFE